jgi:hypothetical protein
MTREVTERATPMSGSSISDTIRSAHSNCTISGDFRYRRNSVRAAFFFTKDFEVLQALGEHVGGRKPSRRDEQSVDVGAQGVAHFPAANIGNGMQGQAVVELVEVAEILSNAIDDEVKQFMLLVEEEGDGQVADLLFRVFGGGDQVYGLQVPEIDIESVDVDVQQLSLLDQAGNPQGIIPRKRISCERTRPTCRLANVSIDRGGSTGGYL